MRGNGPLQRERELSVNVGTRSEQRLLLLTVRGLPREVLLALRASERDDDRFTAAVVHDGCTEMWHAAQADGAADPIEFVLRAFRKKPGLVQQLAESILDLSGYVREPAGPPPPGMSVRTWSRLDRGLRPLPSAFAVSWRAAHYARRGVRRHPARRHRAVGRSRARSPGPRKSDGESELATGGRRRLPAGRRAACGRLVAPGCASTYESFGSSPPSISAPEMARTPRPGRASSNRRPGRADMTQVSEPRARREARHGARFKGVVSPRIRP